MPAVELREWVEAFRLDLGLKLLVAVLAGGAIGLERSLRRKPAGLRTKSSPMGAIEQALNPISVALAAEAARWTDH